ncbi:MAG: lysophospholipid acyltransferase family protein [Dokdonella sp.]
MLNVEHSMRQRLPWLEGYPLLSKLLSFVLRNVTDETRFNFLLDEAGGAAGLEFVDRILELLGTSYQIDAGFAVPVPGSGPLLVVANHPLGMQDALVLLQWLGSVRADVRMLGNDWLASVPQLEKLLVPIDVFRNGESSRARHLYRSLENGEALIMFPAGEVSRLRAGRVQDSAWSDGFARLSIRLGAPVLPVHVKARNSSVFYAVSMLCKPLSTALLPREATAPMHRRIGLRIGAVVSAQELDQRSGGSSRRAAELMRSDVYLVAQQSNPFVATDAPLKGAARKDEIVAELLRSDKLADLSDGKQLFLFTGDPNSALMRELGRLREVTFRTVGEGSGKSIDLDEYDAHYEHLVLWDATAQCIAGAYRLGHAARLCHGHGIPRLYTATLFDFSPAFQSRVMLGLELGRSFVTPAYWHSRSLEQLWQGIGLYLQKHPELHFLFGAVSMPITLPREAREWIAASHLQHFGAPDLAVARQPFIVSSEIDGHVKQACEGLDPRAAMSRLKQHLQTLGVSLPMLYRQYVDLAEPGGVQFLAFGDDPGFSGCVDGLVCVDLGKLKPGKRARYLGVRSPNTAVQLSHLAVAGADSSGSNDSIVENTEEASDALVAL